MGVAYALGLQTSDDPKYIKVAACGKHYAVHDGPENVPQDRLEFVANVTEHDMLDSYLPQFRTLVQRANVAQIMCAYSSVNRSDYAPDCANSYLLQDALRTRFGFQGMVISDNGALEFEVSTHHYYKDYVTAAAASLNAGACLRVCVRPLNTVGGTCALFLRRQACGVRSGAGAGARRCVHTTGMRLGNASRRVRWQPCACLRVGAESRHPVVPLTVCTQAPTTTSAATPCTRTTSRRR